MYATEGFVCVFVCLLLVVVFLFFFWGGVDLI